MAEKNELPTWLGPTLTGGAVVGIALLSCSPFLHQYGISREAFGQWFNTFFETIGPVFSGIIGHTEATPVLQALVDPAQISEL